MTRTNAPSSERSSRSRPSASRDAEAGGVQELEQRPVAAGRPARGGVQQALHLGLVSVSGSRRGIRGRSRWAATSIGDQALPEREPVEALDRGGSAPEARRGEAGIDAAATTGPRGEVAQRGVGALRPVAGGAARIGEVGQVAAVGADRRRGRPRSRARNVR